MLKSFTAVLLTSVCAIGAAQAQDAFPFSPQVEFSAGANTQSANAQLGVFVPFALGGETIAFGELRVGALESGTVQASLGLGVRQRVSPDWIVGAHAHYDIKQTGYGNTFGQVSGGLEMLGERFEMRANAYLPVGTQAYAEDSLSAVVVDNGVLGIRRGMELALYGVDFEAGLKIPVLDSGNEFKLFAGGFHLDAEQTSAISGVKARGEVSLAALDQFIPGASLNIGAQAQYTFEDNALNAGVFARLRVPIGGSSPPSSAANPFTQRVERTEGIATQAGAYGDLETATFAGNAVSKLAYLPASASTAADVNAFLAASGENAVIFASGDILTNSTIMMLAGQQLVGGGGVVELIGGSSGTSAYLRNGGPATTLRAGPALKSAASLTALSDPQVDMLSLANNSRVSNLTIEGGKNGIVAKNVSGAVIENVSVSSTSENGILAVGAKNLTITHALIEQPQANGIMLRNSKGVSITDTAIRDLPICENNTLCEFQIYDPTVVPNAAINAVGTSDLTIADVRMSDVTYGLFASSDIDNNYAVVTQASNLKIDDLAITNSRREAVLLAGIDGVGIQDLSIDNMAMKRTMDLVVFQGSRNIAVDGASLKGGLNALMFVDALDIFLGEMNFDIRNVAISDTKYAGIFLNPVSHGRFSHVTVSNAGSFGIDSNAFWPGPVADIAFTDVTIENAAMGGVNFLGSFEDLSGDITVTGSSACKAPYADLTQGAGKSLQINGTKIMPGSLSDC